MITTDDSARQTTDNSEVGITVTEEVEEFQQKFDEEEEFEIMEVIEDLEEIYNVNSSIPPIALEISSQSEYHPNFL